MGRWTIQRSERNYLRREFTYRSWLAVRVSYLGSLFPPPQLAESLKYEARSSLTGLNSLYSLGEIIQDIWSVSLHLRSYWATVTQLSQVVESISPVQWMRTRRSSSYYMSWKYLLRQIWKYIIPNLLTSLFCVWKWQRKLSRNCMDEQLNCFICLWHLHWS